MIRLAVVVSHPIQYHAPWFRALSRRADLTVFFCQKQSSIGQAEAGFGVEFEWDVDLLSGYRSEWLTNRSSQPNVSRFSGCDTPELFQRITRKNFDACIVSGWYLKSYLQTIAAARLSGVPLLMRGDSQLSTPRSTITRTLKRLPYRMMLSQIDGHLCVGINNRAYLRHYGVREKRIFFVPHFVDNDFFRSRGDVARLNGDAAAVRAHLGIDGNACVALFVGKFIDKKRPQDFVRAVADARKQQPALVGVMVGSGPLHAELQQLSTSIGADVRFAGFRNQTELPTMFAAASFLVLPSDGGETWGLVVNEAMACGLPAIVSDRVGCAPDLIADESTGYQFPVADISTLADRMVRLTSAIVARPDTFEHAVRNRIDGYSCPRAVEGTMHALDAVIGRAHSAPFAANASDRSASGS